MYRIILHLTTTVLYYIRENFLVTKLKKIRRTDKCVKGHVVKETVSYGDRVIHCRDVQSTILGLLEYRS